MPTIHLRGVADMRNLAVFAVGYTGLLLVVCAIGLVLRNYPPGTASTDADIAKMDALMEYWSHPPCDLRRAVGDGEEYADNAAVALARALRTAKAAPTDEAAWKAVRTAEARQAEAEACVAKPPLTEDQRLQAIIDAAKNHTLNSGH